MTNSEFNKRIKLAKMRSKEQIEALRMILVNGKSAYAASNETGIDQAQISKARKRIERDICECCGQFRNQTHL